MYRLLFQNHVASKEPVVVDVSSFTIGRDTGCQLRLCEDGVADRHARIEQRADGYHLRDLNTPNGVLVNGQRASEHRLASGDELEIGAVRMRFEIVHGVATGTQRRPLDLLQLAAATIVVLVIAGQVALLSSVFSETRSRKMNLDTSRGWRGQQAVIGQAEPAAAAVPVTSAVSEPPPPARAPTPSAAVPTVLNRMIRIVRVDRSENEGVATLSIQAKAQVGERELDTSAVAICVQFAVPGGTAKGAAWREPVWLAIPAWENFKNKVFTARFPGAASELAGFVVRTYYRNQLQDIAVAPASLQSFVPLAPNPVPGGAP
jgi:pSer/pThr/pTyr-binding forkhead associated (FHA) protein